jgi:hypothetical protein
MQLDLYQRLGSHIIDILSNSYNLLTGGALTHTVIHAPKTLVGII